MLLLLPAVPSVFYSLAAHRRDVWRVVTPWSTAATPDAEAVRPRLLHNRRRPRVHGLQERPLLLP